MERDDDILYGKGRREGEEGREGKEGREGEEGREDIYQSWNKEMWNKHAVCSSNSASPAKLI